MHKDDTLLLKVRGLLPSLNPALKKIALFILKNPQEVKLLRIKDLASRCGVAEATVTRFVKTIGLGSFQELKINIAEITTQRHTEKELVYDDVMHSDSIESLIEKIIASNKKALSDTKKLINIREIERAIAAIRDASQVDIYGAGGSYVTAENARMRFYRIGKRCIVYNDPNQQAVSASLLTKTDLAIGISNSGRTVSTVNALRRAKESGATTICITNFNQSPITKYADIRLFTSTQDSAFFQESMISRVAQMVLIDILYAGLAIQSFDDSIAKIEISSDSLRNVLL
jgi:RpiR family carbohydrate utilization transcriptional regulator